MLKTFMGLFHKLDLVFHKLNFYFFHITAFFEKNTFYEEIRILHYPSCNYVYKYGGECPKAMEHSWECWLF